jgi:hypothetical protein
MSDLVKLSLELRREYEVKVAALNQSLNDQEMEYRLINTSPGMIGTYRVQLINTLTGKIENVFGPEKLDKKLKRLERKKNIEYFENQDESDLNKILFESIDLINKFKNQINCLS